MTNLRTIQFSTFVAIASIFMALLLPIMQARVSALSSTSLSLSDPRPLEIASYTFSSNGFTTGTGIQCIDLFLNTDSDGSGSGVGTTTAFTLNAASTAITAASWTEDTTVNGRLRLTAASAQNPSANGTIIFDNITNSAVAGTTYYGVFRSYTDIGCTTPSTGVDAASVSYVLKEGELVQLTVDPTLFFTCSPVATGQTVNGVTTTAPSTGSGIDFGNDVTSVANGISAHDINVATNAPGGYTVSIRHTAQLTNGSSDTIDDFAGTNAAPALFTAPGTEGWGYTTEDSTLAGAGGLTRFTSASNFAGFSTTNQPVIDNTAATSGTETTRVGHQVGVAATTESGTYQTTIVYTIASVY